MNVVACVELQAAYVCAVMTSELTAACQHLSQGGMAYSQTDEQAKASANTDAIAMSKGKPGKRRTEVTAMAENIAVNYIPAHRAAKPGRGSVGVSTAQRVGALAMSGVSNGEIGEPRLPCEQRQGAFECAAKLGRDGGIVCRTGSALKCDARSSSSPNVNVSHGQISDVGHCY